MKTRIQLSEQVDRFASLGKNSRCVSFVQRKPSCFVFDRLIHRPGGDVLSYRVTSVCMMELSNRSVLRKRPSCLLPSRRFFLFHHQQTTPCGMSNASIDRTLVRSAAERDQRASSVAFFIEERPAQMPAICIRWCWFASKNETNTEKYPFPCVRTIHFPPICYSIWIVA